MMDQVTEPGITRVLVVEDDGLVAHMVREMLVRAGYEVVGIARDGGAALEAVARLKPDIVLMDLVMPEMDGIEATRRIQEIRPTPVIVLTAYEAPELDDDVRSFGIEACLSKPPAPHELDRAIVAARTHFAQAHGC
jgi:CheY-like chemotaxis protein